MLKQWNKNSQDINYDSTIIHKLQTFLVVKSSMHHEFANELMNMNFRWDMNFILPIQYFPFSLIVRG